MKELSIEEKAQAYDEAKSIMEKYLKSGNAGVIAENTIKKAFPELAELENEDIDEKVRKALIKLVTNHASMDLFIEYDIHSYEALAWLEKQSKQKNVWSKEDEKMLNDILMCGERHCYLDAENIAWLKNLKNHVQPQNSNITDEKLAQAKKDAYNDALDKIEYYSSEPTFGDGWDAAIWYLKKRNIISTWKPSDKQLEVMSYLAKYYAMGIDEPNRSIIISLYEDLQKLRKK